MRVEGAGQGVQEQEEPQGSHREQGHPPERLLLQQNRIHIVEDIH